MAHSPYTNPTKRANVLILLCNSIHSLMVYTHLLSARHLDTRANRVKDLFSWSLTNELVNTPTATQPYIKHLSTIFGSSLLLYVRTVPRSYCDSSPTPKSSSPTPLAYPRHWPCAGTSTMMSPNWDKSLAFLSNPPANTGISRLSGRQS